MVLWSQHDLKKNYYFLIFFFVVQQTELSAGEAIRSERGATRRTSTNIGEEQKEQRVLEESQTSVRREGSTASRPSEEQDGVLKEGF